MQDLHLGAYRAWAEGCKAFDFKLCLGDPGDGYESSWLLILGYYSKKSEALNVNELSVEQRLLKTPCQLRPKYCSPMRIAQQRRKRPQNAPSRSTDLHMHLGLNSEYPLNNPHSDPLK